MSSSVLEQNVTESPFGIEELFFSRTDLQGRILAGNKVFQRVSGYDWQSMHRKPHNIIRHPDMPRGVFHLFWSYIENQKPIGAYVKNQARDGRHYWVYALALPLTNEYLSVRLKPSGKFFDIVKSVYIDLKEFESKSGVTPEASHKELLSRLNALGYSDYAPFMMDCLLNELQARDQALGKPPAMILLLLQTAAENSMDLLKNTETMVRSLQENQYLPLNLEIASSSLESTGRAISVVASSYQNLVTQVSKEMALFKTNSDSLVALLRDNQFMMSIKYLLDHVVEFFKIEDNSGTEIDVSQESARLNDLAIQYALRVSKSVGAVVDSLSQFASSCEIMRSSVSGLEIMRLTGKIEAARLGAASDEITVIIGQLKKFQSLLLDVLTQIESTSGSLREYSNRLLE